MKCIANKIKKVLRIDYMSERQVLDINNRVDELLSEGKSATNAVQIVVIELEKEIKELYKIFK